MYLPTTAILINFNISEYACHLINESVRKKHIISLKNGLNVLNMQQYNFIK